MNTKLYQYLIGAVLGLLAMQLAAQPYPHKPISLVLPQAAGGIISTQAEARAAKDGHTLFLRISQVGENCESFGRPA